MTYPPSSLRRAIWTLGATALLFAAACRGPDPTPAAEFDAAMPGAVDLAGPRPRDLAGSVADLGTAPDLAGMMWPGPMPPPTSCNMRSMGVTAIQGVLRIDEYKGLQTGRNGVHEIAEATLIHTVWVYDRMTVDTTNIHLAMNVASVTDPAGLPMEIPLRVGQTIETEGEYIPASKAGATNKNGAAAVVHFTHMPCGYAVIGGTTYR
jgi:hypothetical protein